MPIPLISVGLVKPEVSTRWEGVKSFRRIEYTETFSKDSAFLRVNQIYEQGLNGGHDYFKLLSDRVVFQSGAFLQTYKGTDSEKGLYFLSSKLGDEERFPGAYIFHYPTKGNVHLVLCSNHFEDWPRKVNKGRMLFADSPDQFASYPRLINIFREQGDNRETPHTMSVKQVVFEDDKLEWWIDTHWANYTRYRVILEPGKNALAFENHPYIGQRYDEPVPVSLLGKRIKVGEGQAQVEIPYFIHPKYLLRRE